MPKLQYSINENMLKNTVIANKIKIRTKTKYTIVNKEIKQEDDYEAEM